MQDAILGLIIHSNLLTNVCEQTSWPSSFEVNLITTAVITSASVKIQYNIVTHVGWDSSYCSLEDVYCLNYQITTIFILLANKAVKTKNARLVTTRIIKCKHITNRAVLACLGALGPPGWRGPPVETPKVQCSICQKSGGSPIGEHRRCEDRVAAGGGGTPSPVYPLPNPQPTRGFGERRELLSGVRGGAPAANEFLAYFRVAERL